MTALVRGSLLQMANGTVLAVDEADPIARQADGSLAIRLVTTPGGPAYQLLLSAARLRFYRGRHGPALSTRR